MFARSTIPGIPEPQDVGRATSTALTHFFTQIFSSQRGGPGGIVYDMLFQKTCDFFAGVARLVWKELPLFVMLVVFMTVPSRFGESGDFVRCYIGIVLPQAILPAFLLCWLSSLRRWIWWTVFIVANIIFFIELGCYFCQGTRFSSVLAVLFLQTNANEAKEFVEYAAVSIAKAGVVSIVIAGMVILWSHLWKRMEICVNKSSLVLSLLGVVFVLSVVFSFIKINT